MIDFTKTFPTVEQFAYYGVENKVIELYEQHKRSYVRREERAPSKSFFLEAEIKNQEAFRDGLGWLVTYDNDLNLYPFFKDGWDFAIGGNYEYPNNGYKFQSEIKSQIQEKFKNADPPKGYFEKLVKVCVEEVFEGMARYLYYIWLKEGAKDMAVARQFKTNLDENERIELCDRIISEKGGKQEAKEDNRLFIDITEAHRPTLMYLLGGKYPEKVEIMKVAVIGNLSTLLKKITDVDGVGKNSGTKVIPEFMKRFCIEFLRKRDGGSIKAIK
jgi:hypothetical protein